MFSILSIASHLRFFLYIVGYQKISSRQKSFFFLRHSFDFAFISVSALFHFRSHSDPVVRVGAHRYCHVSMRAQACCVLGGGNNSAHRLALSELPCVSRRITWSCGNTFLMCLRMLLITTPQVGPIP